MAFIAAAAIGAGGSLLSGLFGSSSAKKAAKAQAAAAQAATAESKRQFDLQRGDLAPYRELGYSTLPTLKGAYGLGTDEENAAAFDRFKTATPDYGFGFDEGQRATQGALNASGMGLRGGGALKALTRYGQDYATTRFGNWRTGLGVPAGIGGSAVQQGNQASQNYANAYGANARAAGDARASGYIGAGQAWGNAVSDIGQIGAYGLGKGWFGNPFGGSGSSSNPWYGVA